MQLDLFLLCTSVISWYIMIHHDTSWYIAIHHDTSWYIMIHHDTSWYIMIHHDTSCIFKRHPVSLYFVPWRLETNTMLAVAPCNHRWRVLFHLTAADVLWPYGIEWLCNLLSSKSNRRIITAVMKRETWIQTWNHKTTSWDLSRNAKCVSKFPKSAPSIPVLRAAMVGWVFQLNGLDTRLQTSKASMQGLHNVIGPEDKANFSKWQVQQQVQPKDVLCIKPSGFANGVDSIWLWLCFMNPDESKSRCINLFQSPSCISKFYIAVFHPVYWTQ